VSLIKMLEITWVWGYSIRESIKKVARWSKRYDEVWGKIGEVYNVHSKKSVYITEMEVYPQCRY